MSRLAKFWRPLSIPAAGVRRGDDGQQRPGFNPASELPPEAAERLRRRAAILNSNWLPLGVLVVAATLG